MAPSLPVWPTQRWLILTAHGNGYCHQWQQRQNRQDRQALMNSLNRPKSTQNAKHFGAGFGKLRVWPPKKNWWVLLGLLWKKSTQSNETKLNKFFLVGKSLSLGPTSQIQPGKSTAGTPKKWKWMEDDVPFQLADFVGAKAVNFQGLYWSWPNFFHIFNSELYPLVN